MSLDTFVAACSPQLDESDGPVPILARRRSAKLPPAIRATGAIVGHLVVSRRACPRPAYSRQAVAGSGGLEVHGDDSPPTFERAIAVAREEIAHLTSLLRELPCRARLCRTDGVETPLSFLSDGIGADADTASSVLRSSGRDLAPTNCAPIHDPEGRLYATLHIRLHEIDRSTSLDRVLEALSKSVAGAITERWFRLQHRHHWIVAAQRRDRTEEPLALAVDRHQRILGADHNARRLLGLRRLNPEAQPILADFFSIGDSLLNDTSGRDVALRVLRCSDGVSYSVLITSPDPSAMTLRSDERLRQHTRPRSDVMAHSPSAVEEEEETRGLPRRRLRQVQAYIDAQINSALPIRELAACVGLSGSHFSRSFTKSVGMTPHNYILRRRVFRAQQLLEDSKLSLVEIAMSTGFSDQSHFSRRFRELVGLSPMAFRVRHR
jgi:AraC-like DNA-binding protein